MNLLGRTRRVAARQFLALCLAGAFFGATSPASAVTSFGDVDISPEPTPVGRSEHGYVEYRFVLVNRSPRDAHVVGLVMGELRGGLRISRSVKLGPS